MSAELIEAILVVIEAENRARAAANAAEPYVHHDYEVHEQRINRLVAVLADGDEAIARRFTEALFDITYDGMAWLRSTWAAIVAERAFELAD